MISAFYPGRGRSLLVTVATLRAPPWTHSLHDAFEILEHFNFHILQSIFFSLNWLFNYTDNEIYVRV